MLKLVLDLRNFLQKMKILNITRTYRNLMRIKQIIQVLTKHGFGHLVARLHLATYIPNLRNIGILMQVPPYLMEDSAAVRARMVLQELGPTFVKLGQILSGRPDILSQEFVNEFKLLQDRVPPFPVEQAKAVIAQEFQSPIEKLFLFFDQKVLASGSIGQVHCATLQDGQDVIIKVKRPGIEKIIETDIAILRFLAELAEKYVEELRILQPIVVVDEFARTIQREMDFTAEAAYTEKFHTLLKDESYIISPRVYWKYTTHRVITLEKLHGINIGEYKKLQKMGIDLKVLARNLIASFTKQYFVWGMFHADPHPGNILVGKDGKICLVDFGMVGHLSEELKSQLATTIIALMKNDLDTIIEVYADIGVFHSNQFNRRDLKTDILELLDKYFNTPFYHIDMAKAFQDIIQVGRNHKIIFPRDFVLLGKSLVMTTTLAKELDPDFNLARALAPHVSFIVKEKLSPKKLINGLMFNLWTSFSLLQKLPTEIKEILRMLKGGNMRMNIAHDNMDKYLRDFHRIANRLSFSIVLASIILGSSLLIKTSVGPQYADLSLIGIIGYIIAGIMILWLIASIIRSGSL